MTCIEEAAIRKFLPLISIVKFVYENIGSKGNTLRVRSDHKTRHIAHQNRHMVTFGWYIFNNIRMVILWCL